MSALLESINTGAPPATYGEGERPPRGDYARARADYTCEQRHDAYTAVEPDVFHDLYGHVPLLFNPVFADYMQAYGVGGLKASRLEACEYLARLYWYTVEFGLIDTREGLRAYGAGILSSAGELRHSITSRDPRRVAFALQRLMRTRYKIDSYQTTYFVIESFDQLFDATAPDFTPVYAEVRNASTIEAGALLDC